MKDLPTDRIGSTEYLTLNVFPENFLFGLPLQDERKFIRNPVACAEKAKIQNEKKILEKDNGPFLTEKESGFRITFLSPKQAKRKMSGKTLDTALHFV